MKLIRCELEVDQLERVINAVTSLTVGVTVWEAREDNKSLNYRAVYRGHAYEVSPPRSVLEIVIDESWVEDILRTLATVNKSEAFGSERVRVFNVEASVHVRTGFTDF
jgi:nitrogen regulatory protein PII